MKRHCIFSTPLLLALVAALSAPPSSLGAEERVDIEVRVIHGSNSGEPNDPELGDLERRLTAHFNYKTYRVLSTSGLKLKVGERGSVAIPGERMLYLEPGGIQGNMLDLTIELVGRSEYRATVSRGSVHFIAGPKHEGGVLFIAIMPQF